MCVCLCVCEGLDVSSMSLRDRARELCVRVCERIVRVKFHVSSLGFMRRVRE